MPKIRINPRAISGDGKIVIGTHPRWIESSTGSNRWMIAINYDYYYGRENTTLSNLMYYFSKNLSEYLPENSYLTKFNIYFYLLSGEIGQNSNYDIYIADKLFETKNQNLNGWNKISISANNIPDLSKTEEIRFYPCCREYKSHDFITDYIYAPGPTSGYYEDPYPKYRMPEKYIYEFCSLTSSYPPYIEIEYSYNPPKASDTLNPNEVTLNPKTAIRFSWNSKINQQAFELQYKINNGDWQTVKKQSSERYFELAPGTIKETEGTVNWRVRVSEYEDIYSEWTNASFIIGSVPQPLPQLIKPVGDYIYDKNISFEWQFISSTTEEQQGYDIELNDGNGYKRIGYSETSKEQSYSYTISTNEESKIIYWRLRVRNQFGEWSEWTEGASFQIVGKPPAPQIINVENNNRPLIEWTARDQEMYEITIYNKDKELVYESGEILDINKKHKLKKDLANGKYFIYLKTKNIYGIESPEIAFTHIINPEPIEEPKIEIYNSYYCVTIKSDYKDGTVYRNEIEVGRLIDGLFEDYTGANLKLYEYKIRAYKNDVYRDSKKVSGRCFFESNNTIAPLNNPKDLKAISWNLDSMPNKKVDYSLQSASIRLESLKFPFIEYSEQANEVMNFTIFVKTKKEIEDLYRLIDLKTELIYRDTRGFILIGAILGINYDHNMFGYSVGLSIIRTSDRYE